MGREFIASRPGPRTRRSKRSISSLTHSRSTSKSFSLVRDRMRTVETKKSADVLQFSNRCDWNASTQKPTLKIRRAETSSAPSTRSNKPKLPLIALCEGPTRNQVLLRTMQTLQTLDVEQIQIAEIVIEAIARGRL